MLSLHTPYRTMCTCINVTMYYLSQFHPPLSFLSVFHEHTRTHTHSLSSSPLLPPVFLPLSTHTHAHTYTHTVPVPVSNQKASSFHGPHVRSGLAPPLPPPNKSVESSSTAAAISTMSRNTSDTSINGGQSKQKKGGLFSSFGRKGHVRRVIKFDDLAPKCSKSCRNL